MHKRGLCCHTVSVRLSVCLSVTFVSCVKTNKDIFEFFSPSGNQAIIEFYALVNLKPQQLVIKNRAIGMLKLTTDTHEASRGLSATVELLVLLCLSNPANAAVFNKPLIDVSTRTTSSSVVWTTSEKVYSADADADADGGRARARGLCVLGGLCVDMWWLVHQWSFLLFWLFLTIDTLLVQSW